MHVISERFVANPGKLFYSSNCLRSGTPLHSRKRLRLRGQFQNQSGNPSNSELELTVNLDRNFVSPPTRIRLFNGLRGSDFRHPLDQQNTALLQAIPGLETIAKGMLGPVAEQVLLIENISTSVKVGPGQLPSVHKLLLEAAEILQMECPDVYIRQSPTPNAYTLAIAGRKPFIVLHTSLLELLTLEEIQAVLAHELGHLKCNHGVWLTAANLLALGFVSLIPVVSNAVQEGLLRWLRAAELTCDRAALLVSQNRDVVISVLMKLAGGTPSFANELNVDAFLEQARSYDEATASPLGWYLRNAQTRELSHPLPVMRAREVDRWSQSDQMSAIPDELPSDDDEVDQLDEEIENEIKEALSCPCVSDLKEGPCGGEFVNSFSCFMRNNREGKELENCVKAFNLLQVKGHE
eukprot:g6798.t1